MGKITARTRTLLIMPLLIVYGKAIEPVKQRVCVIGAGVAGLTMAKYLAMYPDDFEPIVFDKQSDVGGMWIYTDSDTVDEHGLPVHSSAYQNLRSNGPKQIAVYVEYEIFGENRSFLSHEDILQYLRNFTDYYELRKFIRFDVNVEKVSPSDDMKWLVSTRNLNDNETDETTCDAVIIASGNTVTGNIPEIPGIETFSGRVFHSHLYRRPEGYANRTVVLLGASSSGMDIGMDLSKHAEKVYLSHRHKKHVGGFPKNIEQIPGVIAAENDYLILSNDTRIKADVIIFCTGYIYDFPFLDSSSGIVVEENGKYIRSIYKHLINIERPTMAILNVPDPGYPLLLPHAQAQYYVAVLRGKIQLPSREEMLDDARVPPGRPKGKAHRVFLDAFSYFDELSTAAGYDPLPSYYKAGFLALIAEVAKDTVHFQENNLYVHDDGSVDFHCST